MYILCDMHVLVFLQNISFGIVKAMAEWIIRKGKFVTPDCTFESDAYSTVADWQNGFFIKENL